MDRGGCSSAGRLIATLSLMMSSCVSRRSRGLAIVLAVVKEGFQGCVGGVGQGDLRSSRVAQDCGRGFVDWRGLGFGRYWALASERRALAVADDERGSFLISVQIAESERHAAGSNNGLKVLTGVSVMCVMSCLLLLLLLSVV
jgi:hypothetical protein